MQWLHRCVFSVLFLLGTANLLAEEQSAQLRVLCYNIHYGQGMDGQYDLERLAGVINTAQPDLVALQEVDVGVARSGRVHQLQELARQTGLHAYYGPTQHYQGGLYGNAILSKFLAEQVVIQPLPYTEATPELTTYPRGAVAIRFSMSNGKVLRFVSTHFQHNLPTDRVSQARAINAHFAADPGDVLLAGDINATPDSEPVRILEQAWHNALDEEHTPTAPANNPRSRIDYIFFRGQHLKLVESRVIPEAMASDHRPVLAVFEIAE